MMNSDIWSPHIAGWSCWPSQKVENVNFDQNLTMVPNDEMTQPKPKWGWNNNLNDQYWKCTKATNAYFTLVV